MEKKKLIQENPKREEDAGRIINIVSHQLKRTIFFYTWKDCGLTTMQNRVLHYILVRSLENPVYQKDLEKEFKVSKSTVTEILQLMERKGFIERKSSKRDGRMKRILPTEKAITIQREVMENIRTVEEKLRAGVTEEDYKTCLKVLKKMSENLAKEEDYMKGREEMYE
ncbi:MULTISPECIES: MarR family winged helix-turn-helix transcriptional regulator [unclassified Blautia]|mgnify:FL=1|uniref:MarR family winged helix-turn-helix transcriptional regulator n=1 Tax=unclassified Blautia TaxID=2648079 RepID=UPI000B368D06|nr:MULTISPECIES: MarR family transcriptional regulator [unclassified Blautia]OUN26947.1 MarR family transcriptional regulator [Blautia sp. An81]OUN93786.1 MarR family transcriptional regulator [Blautia sp. An46]